MTLQSSSTQIIAPHLLELFMEDSKYSKTLESVVLLWVQLSIIITVVRQIYKNLESILVIKPHYIMIMNDGELRQFIGGLSSTETTSP